MEQRAISNLAQLSDEEFFKEVAIGMELVSENASAMEADAALLIDQKRWRGAAVLRAIAEEEASKYLILLDAVRCPRSSNEEKKVFARHLNSFNEHLAKGIYAEYCYINPVNFAEARRYIESLRPELYLDGPEYSLWLYRNRILQRREARLYVDYLNTDEGKYWTTPAGEAEIFGEPLYSAALRLVTSFQKLGMASRDALSIISSIWRPIPITNEFHFSQAGQLTGVTLRTLAERGLLHGSIDSEAAATIVDRWLFPLYPLDLRPLKVDRNALREAQRAEADRFYEQF